MNTQKTQSRKGVITPKRRKRVIVKKLRRKFKAGTMGTTTIDQIKSLNLNRGRKESIDMKRINGLADIINDQRWYDMAGSRVTINVYGVMVDGNHTAHTFAKLGLPIPYYVTTHKALNVPDESKLINAISDYNSWNSQWTKGDAFECAMEYDKPLAKRINEIVQYLSAETSIPTNKFKNSWIIGLIMKDKTLFKSSKGLNKTEIYDNTDMFNASNGMEFKRDLLYFIKLINAMDSLVRFAAPVFEVLHLHWSNAAFDIDKFIDKVETFGFRPESEKIQDLREEIQKVYNSQRGQLKNYEQLYKGMSAHRNFNGLLLPTYSYTQK